MSGAIGEKTITTLRWSLGRRGLWSGGVVAVADTRAERYSLLSKREQNLPDDADWQNKQQRAVRDGGWYAYRFDLIHTHPHRIFVT